MEARRQHVSVSFHDAVPIQSMDVHMYVCIYVCVYVYVCVHI